MQIRFKVLAGIFALMIAMQAAAEAPVAMSPVLDTTPFNPEDKSKVIVFFKYNCPVCRNYHMSLAHWGQSLPKGISLQFNPVLEGDASGTAISEESTRGSLMFWTVEKSGNRTQRSDFSEAAYELTQDKHLQDKPEAWVRAAIKTGINFPNFKTALKFEQDAMGDRTERQIHYRPTATPTMVVCGKWMITPDSTNGDTQMFIQLANGLVSKCLGEKGLAKY